MVHADKVDDDRGHPDLRDAGGGFERAAAAPRDAYEYGLVEDETF